MYYEATVQLLWIEVPMQVLFCRATYSQPYLRMLLCIHAHIPCIECLPIPYWLSLISQLIGEGRVCALHVH